MRIYRLFSRLLPVLLIPTSALAGSAAFPSPALAASLVVTTIADDTAADDECSLREAITNANDDALTYADCLAAGSGNDTITFFDDLGTATITLTSPLPTILGAAGLTIDGGGDITVDGNNAVQMLNMDTSASLTLENITLANGFATFGAGIRTGIGSVLVINNSTLSGHSIWSSDGAAINAFNTTLTITNSTFENNDSTSIGGPGFGSGGAIAFSFGTTTITNSTFTGNISTYENGGAVYNDSGALTLRNSTFTGNTAGLSGADVYNHARAQNADLNLYNTLLGNPVSGGDCVNFEENTFTVAVAGTHNLIEDASNACGLADGVDGNITGEDPLLGAPAGSPAYFPIEAGSPAIDAGDDAVCSAAPVGSASQNGLTRPIGAHCDIGSYETALQTGAALTVNAAADDDDGACDVPTASTDCTLREALLAAEAYSGDNDILFADALGTATITLTTNLPAITEPAGLDILGGGDITLDGADSYVLLSITGSSSVVTLDGLAFRNGSALSGGALANSGFLTITNSSFSNNHSTAGCGICGGGAIFNNGGSITIEDSSFTQNTAQGLVGGPDAHGGAIFNNDGWMQATDSTFKDNTADYSGGAVHTLDGYFFLVNSTLTGNESLYDAGGAVYSEGGLISSVFSTLSGNTSYNGGGGLFTEETGEIINSTLWDNESTGNVGGGVYNSGELYVFNSTLTGNRAATDGDGLYNQSTGTLYLTNSILGNSPAARDCVNNGGTVDGDHSLIESGAPNACGLADGVDGNLIGVDPDLLPMTGAPAYFPLDSASPAVDAGDDLTCSGEGVANASQNGVTRPQDGDGDASQVCDIGSYELSADGSIDVFVAGSEEGDYVLAPGSVTWDEYPSLIDGPLNVVSNNDQLFHTSQRVTSGTSYNELMGFPNNQISNEYWFPWYDHGYPSVGGSSMRTWVLVGNPDGALTADVDIFIGGTLMGSYSIPPGSRVTPRWIGLQDGPVQVLSDIPVIASERVFTAPNNSFNEMMGIPQEQFAGEYWFPWFDSVNMNTTLQIGNGDPAGTAAVDVYIGGSLMNSYVVPAASTLLQTYASTVDGPVRVVVTDGNSVVASEAVLSGSGNSFNEVMGYPFDQFDTEYFFPYYDHGYPGVSGNNMRTWILVGNPDEALTAEVEIYIAGVLQGSYSILPGARVTPRWIGTVDGPVQVRSDIPVFASQRVFTAPGNVFNEMMGYPASQLTDQYWFPWYDSVNMGNEILIARP